MREIKFRAYDPELGRYICNYFSIIGEVTIFNGLEIMISETPIEGKTGLDRLLGLAIEQFTGFKDKNGKEIYENDLYKVGLSNVYYQVFFKNGCWYGGITNERSEPLFMNIEDDKFEYVIPDWFEVIGNIHESTSKPV